MMVTIVHDSTLEWARKAPGRDEEMSIVRFVERLGKVFSRALRERMPVGRGCRKCFPYSYPNLCSQLGLHSVDLFDPGPDGPNSLCLVTAVLALRVVRWSGRADGVELCLFPRCSWRRVV